MPHSSPETLRPARSSRRGRRRFWLTGYGALFALAALLAAVVGNAVEAAHGRRAAESAYVHTLDVLLVTGQLSTQVNAALRYERGYLLTTDADILVLFDGSRRRIARIVARLAALTRDNRAQRATVAALEARSVDYLDFLSRTMALQTAGEDVRARRAVIAGGGRDRINAVLALVARVEATERALLRRRRAANEAANRRIDRSGVALAGLGLGLLLLVGGAGFASLRAHRRLLRATADLERIATTDALTGLPNRRAFFTALQIEMARAARSGEPLSLAVLDVDHFKRINDVHGHPAGDAVLADAADTMRDALRAGDVVGRIGGEEFAILMPATDAAGAHHVCERLRAAIAAGSVPVPGTIGVATGVGMTISTGIALLRAAEPSASLLSRADRALYAAKSGGRNQVRLAA